LQEVGIHSSWVSDTFLRFINSDTFLSLLPISLPTIQVQYNSKRGFYFSVPMTEFDAAAAVRAQQESTTTETPGASACSRPANKISGAAASRGPPAPRGFAVLQASGRNVHCTTDELSALNSRLKDAGHDCLMLTEQVLEGVAATVVSRFLPSLHRLVDGIALLDMLAGFAACMAEGGRVYVRPTLTESGALFLFLSFQYDNQSVIRSVLLLFHC
jgi:DNA mismatch repair ATPase MutS